jgi:hypothetical protein
MADSAGVTLAVHPHLGTLILTPDEIARVLAESRVSLCVDSGHAYPGGNDVVELIRTAGSRLAHVHLKDVDRELTQRMNRGEIDFLEAVRRCGLIVKRKGMEMSGSTRHSRHWWCRCPSEFKSFGARLPGLANPTVKESSMRVKKRVKRRVKKGIKRVKSAPPEAYLAGAGVLVGGAAVVLLATTKSGRELLIRTAQLTLSPEADEPESQESDVPEADEQDSQESDAREDVDNEPAEDADAEAEPEEDTNGDAESRVTDLKPRSATAQRSPRKAPAQAQEGGRAGGKLATHSLPQS